MDGKSLKNSERTHKTSGRHVREEEEVKEKGRGRGVFEDGIRNGHL